MKQLTDYTIEELRNMPAGAECDALIEHYIFDEACWIGVHPDGQSVVAHEDDPNFPVPDFSISIADAWRAVEALYDKPKVQSITLTRNKEDRPDGRWACYIHVAVRTQINGWLDTYAPTAPLAICRAALIAWRYELQEEVVS